MCTGAIINARIPKVYFGASDAKAGSCGSVADLLSLPYNHKAEVVPGLMEKECAEILRNITLYHNIRKAQVIKLHPNISPEVCEKIIFHLQNNRRIYHDKTTDIIYDNSDGNTDFEMIYCLWVICDFIDKTEYHSSSDFPVNAVFFADGELYELSFIPENK